MGAESTRPDLAVFSLLPPNRSGIADYTVEQSSALSREWDVTVVVADDAPRPSPQTDFKACHISEWKANPVRDTKTPRLYHMGNNPSHLFLLEEMRRRPGVTILHDQSLHHMLAMATVDQRDQAAYESILTRAMGEAGRDLAKMRRYPVASLSLPFLLPLNNVVAERSLGVVVHSRLAKSNLNADWPELELACIPHHFSPPPFDSASDRAEARKRLGLASETLLFVSLGFVTPPKQIPLVLRALASARERLAEFQYWIVGEANDPIELRREIDKHGLSGHVHLAGYVGLTQFHDFILASDVVINLRYPSAGETSGNTIRTLGMGRCQVVFDYGSFAELLADSALKIPLDTSDHLSIGQALVDLANAPAKRAVMEEKAARAAKQGHNLDNSARMLGNFLKERFAAPLPRHLFPLEGNSPAFNLQEAAQHVDTMITNLTESTAQTYGKIHRRRLIETVAWLPRARKGMAALELGSNPITLLPAIKEAGFTRTAGSDKATNSSAEIGRKVTLWDGSEANILAFDVERDRFPFRDGEFDLVICCEVIEHLTGDPIAMLKEINRVLTRNGLLLLTTPNIASAKAIRGVLNGHWPYLFPDFRRDGGSDRHNVEYSPKEISALCTAAGFEILKLETFDSWSQKPPDVLRLLRQNELPIQFRGDNIFILAAKRTTMVDRYPVTLYGAGDIVRVLSNE